ncbi:MAG: P-loop NTPase [Actinobacteria bacterium]|nr:P-loop NTPase [Actinomycetota bacterium]
MARIDYGPDTGPQPNPNSDEPANPLRHYAGVLRRRARYSVIGVVVGLALGFGSSFFIKQAPITTHYYKAVNTLVMSGQGDTTNGGYGLDRAAQLIRDDKLLAVVAKQVHSTPIKTGQHLAAQVRGEQYAIDVVAIAENPRLAEKMADAAAAELAKLADEKAAQSHDAQLQTLTEQQRVLQNKISILQADPGQQAQVTIAQSQLGSVQSAIAAIGNSPRQLGLQTAQYAHAIEINEKGYKQRLENSINLPGQLLQSSAPVTSPDQTIDETDLSRPKVPNRIELILIGGVIGLVLGVIASFIVEAWDDKVRSRERVEALCDLPVLAEIPHLSSDEIATHAIAMVDAPKSPVAERYRATCTAALFSLGESATERPNATGSDGSPHTPVILVTSPNPGEGKTTTSANLTAAFADTGRRVLAIDADFRRPALAKFLAPVMNLDDPSLASETRVSGVSFLAAPHGISAVGDMVFELRKLIAEHQNSYDVVIVDTPPMLTTNDAIDLLAAADSTILVLRAGRTRTNSAQRASTVLSRLRADVLGVVLNGCDRKEMENYYGYGYGSGYGYGYGYYYGGTSDTKKKKRKRSRGVSSAGGSTASELEQSDEQVPTSHG